MVHIHASCPRSPSVAGRRSIDRHGCVPVPAVLECIHARGGRWRAGSGSPSPSHLDPAGSRSVRGCLYAIMPIYCYTEVTQVYYTIS